MTENHRDEMIETLNDSLREMDVRVARGIRDESDLDRREFETPHDENPDYVDVIFAGEGIVVVTENFESEDFAWTGDLDDQQVLDDLADEGVLREI